MERQEQKAYLYDLFKKVGSGVEDIVSHIVKIPTVSDRIECYFEIFEKIFRGNFGVYRSVGDNGGYYYFFNGRHYEPVYMEVIWYACDKWMKDVGVPSKDRVNGKYIHLMQERISAIIRDRVLQPRPSLMCFTNCVVDFNHPNRRFAHHQSFDVIKMYQFAYDPLSYRSCPIWRSFLGEPVMMMSNVDGILPEAGKRRALQMFLGSCLADRTNISFEYFMILQGTGANGKSVIYRVLKDMFGEDEIINIKMSQFSRGGDESLRAAFSLKGKRLMYCTESTRGDFKDMSTIKAISSGEPIACREIGGNISTLQRPPVLLCNSNYRWKASDFLNRTDPDDTSMMRRAVILNFEKSIPVEKRDTTLAQRLKAEHSGIFAWIVKGYMELRKNKWRMPEDLKGKVDLEIERNNSYVDIDGKKVVGSIIELIRLKGMSPYKDDEHPYQLFVQSSNLFGLYTEYCRKNGVDLPANIQKFGHDMNVLGYFKMKRTVDTKGVMLYDIWLESEHDVALFLDSVPRITDAVRKSVYKGDGYDDDEYDSYMREGGGIIG